MIGFVDGQLVQIVGLPVPPSVYEITIQDDHAVLLADGKKVEFGVTWFSYSKNAAIHPKSGKIQGKGGKFRAVFAGKSIDFSTVQ